jgi:GNAT superfamily N-acetyltransferase
MATITLSETKNIDNAKRVSLPLRKLYYALLLLKNGGFRAAMDYIRTGLFSVTTYLWLVKDLTSAESLSQSQMRYKLQPASPANFGELVHHLKDEKGQALLELLRRLSFYRRGFDTCYVAMAESGEICYMQWLISPRHNELLRTNFPFRMRLLKEDESMLENAFTFPRFRGKGIMGSVMLELAGIARNQGFKRLVTQVEKNNEASLKGCYRVGFRAFTEQQEVKFLFITWRRKWVS